MIKRLLIALLFAPFMLSSQSVVDIVVNSPEHNTLEAAVLAAGLETTLSGPGPFTLFAPTDDAFNALPAGTIDALLMDPQGALTDILTYHVVGAQALSSDLSDGQVIGTVNGKNITVRINSDGVFINDAKVTMADVPADNGVVHVIDAVLIPPTVTVVDVVVNSPNHNTLEAAVLAAGLETTLSGEGPFTVFAPTDDAFNALPAGTIDALLMDPQGALTDILTYHVVGAKALSTDLSDGQVIGTVNGKEIVVKINSDGVFINDAKVTMADVPADNGVVHVIDAVLMPPTVTVVDVIVNSPNHTTLEAAVLAAGLETTLSGDGPFTVFAPTDDAFNALPPGTIDALLADPQGALTNILTYHVAGGNVKSTDLMSGMRITTANGVDVFVTINANGVFINNAQVTMADVPADNGVVHVIDAVLIPGNSLFDIVSASPNHNTLEAAIRAVGLEDVLTTADDITLFAPTDAAFEALPAGTVDFLLQNPDILTGILVNHVTVESTTKDDILAEGGFTLLPSFAGYFHSAIANENIYTINDINVSTADVEASNGILNVIDGIILNPDSTVLDIVQGSSVHTILEVAIDSTGVLNNVLESYGPFTLFAPIDDAFSGLTQAEIEALLNNPDDLIEILGAHVVIGNIQAEDLSDGQILQTATGDPIRVTINADGVFVNGAKVVAADINADNGVVHAIDAILEEIEVNIWDVVVNSTVHNTLEAAVRAAELDGVLADDDADLTLFAPTDAAFEALPAGTVEALLQDPKGALTDILTYHVLDGIAESSDLSDGLEVETVNGKKVTVRINAQGIFINDAQVLLSDIRVNNGVIHVIDAVLLPPRVTVVDIIVNSDDHNTLEAAVLAAGLETTLSGDGPFTVFAPTDAAFSELPAGTLDALLADPMGMLTDILTYHVVAAKALSTDLSDGQLITTVNGEDVTVEIKNGEIFINNGKVIVKDIETDNGVVHVIDVVLTPPLSTNDVKFDLVKLYPNPVVDRLNYDVSSVTKNDISITIFDLKGSVVAKQMGASVGYISNLNVLESGSYIVEFKNEDTSIRRSLVKI